MTNEAIKVMKSCGNDYWVEGHIKLSFLSAYKELQLLNLLNITPTFTEAPIEPMLSDLYDALKRRVTLTPAGILLVEGLRE